MKCLTDVGASPAISNVSRDYASMLALVSLSLLLLLLLSDSPAEVTLSWQQQCLHHAVAASDLKQLRSFISSSSPTTQEMMRACTIVCLSVCLSVCICLSG